jgi:hypothetical protein
MGPNVMARWWYEYLIHALGQYAGVWNFSGIIVPIAQLLQ